MLSYAEKKKIIRKEVKNVLDAIKGKGKFKETFDVSRPDHDISRSHIGSISPATYKEFEETRKMIKSLEADAKKYAAMGMSNMDFSGDAKRTLSKMDSIYEQLKASQSKEVDIAEQFDKEKDKAKKDQLKKKLDKQAKESEKLEKQIIKTSRSHFK